MARHASPSRRASRRIFGAGVVLATAGLGIALAATGSSVVPAPPVLVVRPPDNMTGSGSATLTNTGSATVQVGELVADGTCDPGLTTTAGGALPFALAAGSAHAVAVTCAATAETSIRRCQFHARTAAHASIADYTGLCVSTGDFALALSPGSGVSFGDVAIGAQRTLPVVLTNTGTTKVTAEAIHVADQGGDFQIGSPCLVDGPGCDATAVIDAGAQLAFDLRCTPTQLGARTTQLFVVTSNGGAVGPYAVDCTGIAGGLGPSIALDVTSVDVGDVDVGSGSASSTVHVANHGTGDLHIASLALVGGATADWSFAATTPCTSTPCTLSSGTSIDVVLTFDPSALDGRPSTLQIHSDDASHPTSVIALTGDGLGATLALATNVGSGVDLGSVAVGASSSFALALRNDGNATLAPVTLAITQTDTAFAIDPDTLSITKSGHATATVTCTPTDHVVTTGTLTITAPDALTGSPLAIPLTCTGVAGNLVATPTPIQLGEIRTGGGIVMKTITLSTLGATVTVTAAPALTTPIAGLTVSEPTATTITGAAPATFVLAIDPQQDVSLADHITVAAGNDLLDLPITGAVVTAAVTPSPTRDLGSFCVGEPTASAIVSLTASGTASVQLASAPAMGLADASPFQLTAVAPSVFPFDLPSGARATAQITPKRAGSAGLVTDDVVWADDVPAALAPHTTIRATFIDDGGAVSPGSVDFGVAPIHLAEPTDQLITIQNCGADAMTLGTPTISPAGAFHTTGTLPLQLLPAQSATISVGFGPVSVGDFSSTLTVSAIKGTDMFDLTVALHGIGEIQSPPTGDDAGAGDTTQAAPHGCGCDTAAGGGAPTGSLLLAVGAVVRRRRRGGKRVP
jgi:uncharacterized protein (TIGR03382 family)